MKKWNYYNDFDPNVCAWAKELIRKGLVPDGEVDCRPIEQIQPEDLTGFIQHHFFCGILGWSLALQLAGWPPDRPVWTGSCPCQPFSAAGKQKGTADERHLWPAFFDLIRQCRPKHVFGEQVAGAIGHGWLDGVSADLESEGYACGAVVLGAHSVGAPHIRQRLYWVADAASREARPAAAVGLLAEPCGGSWLGDSDIQGPQGRPAVRERGDERAPWASGVAIPCADGKSRRVEPSIQLLAHGLPARVVRLRGYGNAIVPQVAAEFVGAYMEIAA